MPIGGARPLPRCSGNDPIPVLLADEGNTASSLEPRKVVIDRAVDCLPFDDELRDTALTGGLRSLKSRDQGYVSSAMGHTLEIGGLSEAAD